MSSNNKLPQTASNISNRQKHQFAVWEDRLSANQLCRLGLHVQIQPGATRTRATTTLALCEKVAEKWREVLFECISMRVISTRPHGIWEAGAKMAAPHCFHSWFPQGGSMKSTSEGLCQYSHRLITYKGNIHGIRGTQQQNDTQQRARLQETTEVKAAPAPPCHWLYSLPNGTAVTPGLQPGQMPTICGGFQRQTAFTGRTMEGKQLASPLLFATRMSSVLWYARDSISCAKLVHKSLF
ncbi:unnamed protein product [Arctogadus glacialis]